MKASKGTVIGLKILVWMALATVPFLGVRWYDEVFVRVADNVFSNVKPIGVALTLSLATILSLAPGVWIGNSWKDREVADFPKEYKFETKGAIMTKDGRALCCKCFCENRREVPLKENKDGTWECVLETKHKYGRWS